MKKTILIALTLTISGCGLLAPVVEKIASGVEKYCEQPYSFRDTYTNTVNSQLEGTGHEVHVHCSGDPAVTP